MARIKSSKTRHAKHKKVLKQAKGFRGAKSKLIKTAKEAVMHSGSYAYAGRKQRKRDKRTEWIVTINAALSEHEIPYSRFIKSLKEKEITLDRKILAKIAKEDKATFDHIVKSATS